MTANAICAICYSELPSTQRSLDVDCLDTNTNTYVEILAGQTVHHYHTICLAKSIKNQPNPQNPLNRELLPTHVVKRLDDWMDLVGIRHLIRENTYVKVGQLRSRYVYTYSPDGSTLLTVNEHGEIFVWNSRTLTKVKKLEFGCQEIVCNLAYTSDQKRILAVSYNTRVFIWDAGTLSLLEDKIDLQHKISYAEFSPDGDNLVTLSDTHQSNERIKIWDLKTKQVIGQFDVQNSYNHTYSPDGSLLLISGEYAICRIVNTKTLTEIAQFNIGAHMDYAFFSHDGTKIVTYDDNGLFKFWDAQSLTELKRLKVNDEDDEDVRISTYAMSRDGTILVTTVAENDSVQIWDLQKMILKYKIVGSGLTGAIISPDGKQIAVQRDTNIEFWEEAIHL